MSFNVISFLKSTLANRGAVPVSDDNPLPVAQTPATPATTSTYTQAAISTASSGDNTLVAGTANQTIRVYRIMWTLASPGTVTLKDGASTSLTGALSAVTGLIESTDGNPLFVTTAGNAFIANLSAAIQMSGAIWYTKS